MRRGDDLEARLADVEEESRRLRDELEACVVLVLQLDAQRARTGYLDEHELLHRLVARLNVLEESNGMRIQTATEKLQASILQLEDEVKDLWRATKHGKEKGELSDSLGAPQVGASIGPKASAPSVAVPSAAVKYDNSDMVDNIFVRVRKKMLEAVGVVEKRVARLEESLARVEAVEVFVQADRKRAGELERAVEIVTQKRKEDKLEVDAQLRELASRILKVDSGATWGKEADFLRAEIEDIRLTKMPKIFEHSTQTSKILAEGLKALREEVHALPTKLGGHAQALVGAESRGGLGIEAAEQLAALKAEIDEVKRQMSGGAEGGLDGRILMLRADISAELESMLRQSREAWADLSRRIAGLEPWKEEISLLHAEVRSVRFDRDEDRSRLDLMVRDEINTLKSLIDRTLQDAKIGGSTALLEGARASSPILPRRGLLDSGAVDSSGRIDLPRVRVYGSRGEWCLSAAVLRSARDYGGGLLVASEFEVLGVPCRLKFFPEGSALRKERGFCSLYLLSSATVEIKFRLFAGKYQTPVLTCEYGRKRDQGRHDLCALDAVLDDTGSVVVGIDITEVRGIAAGLNIDDTSTSRSPRVR